MYLKEGTIVRCTKNSLEELSVNNLRDIEVFRPDDNNENREVVGVYTGVYKVQRTLRLLNLGNVFDRDLVIRNVTNLNDDDWFSCIQDSTDLKIHEAILNSRDLDAFDGTIIGSRYCDDDLRDFLEGKDEIVLFLDRMFHHILLTGVSIEL
jgi:hypothetical protein